jgi:hypothetical protein
MRGWGRRSSSENGATSRNGAGWRNIPIALIDRGSGEQTAQACVIAFHEKAGRSQVDSLIFSVDKVFSRRVAADAILPSALSMSDVISLGASWAFSLQPVLLPDCRPALLCTR